MTMNINLTNLKLENNFYVAEILGIDMKGNPILSKPVAYFAFEGDAIEAKRRMSRKDKATYVVCEKGKQPYIKAETANRVGKRETVKRETAPTIKIIVDEKSVFAPHSDIDESFVGCYDIEEGRYEREIDDNSRDELWNDYALDGQTFDAMVDFAREHGKATAHNVLKVGAYHVDAWITFVCC